MASEHLNIDSLPNEILISIISPLPTTELTRLALINRRFHAIVLRLLHYRLATAAALPQHQLILECYHPSAKLSTPYLNCDYIGTDGLDWPSAASDDDRGRVVGSEDQLSFHELRAIYSRFRPVVQEENRRARSRYPRQQVFAAAVAQEVGSAADAAAEEAAPEPEPASHDVYLDDGELFTQLCTVTNLVKVGPKRGLFLSHVNVSDGLVRVWRDWLSERAAAGPVEEGERAVLWADAGKNVGLRFRVVEKADAHRPVLVAAGEDVPVSYTLEYEELLVRTNQLLLMVEKSDEEEVSSTGLHLDPRGCVSQPVEAMFFAQIQGLQSYERAPSWMTPHRAAVVA